MTPPTLLAVPNVSEGRDEATIGALRAAFAGPQAGAEPADGARAVRLLDVHSDRDHHRSVFTLAAPPGVLAERVLAGARVAVERVDVVARAGGAEEGRHPHVGALDVAPVVYVRPGDRGAACAEALALADRIGAELEVPVFIYGELSAEDPARERGRAELRRGGVLGLARRMERDGEGERLRADFGPSRPHPSAGATLVAARPPLVAFNLRLAPPADVAQARRIAASIREGGEQGLAGVRAIGVELGGGLAQVSMNVERPFEVPLAAVVEAVRAHAPLAAAELVGLAPRAALEGFPPDLPMPGFDPARHVIENALGCYGDGADQA